MASSKIILRTSLPFIIFSGFIFNTTTYGQYQTGKIEYQSLGISFMIPNSWKGAETENGFLIGHDTKPGFILITTHRYNSIEELTKLASLGIQEDDGTLMQMTVGFDHIKINANGAEFEGQMQRQPSKLYIARLNNPFGNGLTIMSGTHTDQYTSEYKSLVHELVTSFQFSKPETDPIVDQWKQELTGSRLTYMKSYSSFGGGYGGYSNTEKIDLWPNGSSRYYQESSISVDVDDASAFSASQDDGIGKWDIVGNANGGVALLLEFNSGSTNEYELTDEEGVYLNGYRY